MAPIPNPAEEAPVAKTSRNPSMHGTTGTNHRDAHNLGAPQSSDSIHHVKSEQTSSTTTPKVAPRKTGEGRS